MRQILLVAAVLGGWTAASAQTGTGAPAPQAPAFGDSIVVTATLEPEERDHVPAAVTVIPKSEIEARQAVALPELMATVPGITVLQTGSPGQQTSVFTRGSESEQTLLLWNGIQLNDPFFGGANWQFLSTDGVERVEVVRGPFSALYGSSAMGGVVQVLTGSDTGLTVRLEAGERGYGRAGATAGFAAGGARVDVAGHARRDDGFFPNDRFDGEELLGRALWTTAPGSSVGLVARFNDSETGIPTNGFQPTPKAEIGWREVELAVPVRATLRKWDLDAQLATVQFDSAFRDPDDPFGFVAGDTESEALRGRAVATYHASSEVWLAFGSEAERLEVDNGSNFGVSLDGAHQRTWAAFGQASWARGPFHVDLGLRHDDNDVYGSATNLRLGGVVDLGGGLRLRAGYGEAFRAPSLGELFFPGSGNPDLQPETGESVEVGLEWADGGWRLALAGFDNRQRNLIELDFATFRNFNLGRTRSRGLEAEAGYRRGIASARVNGTYLDAEDRDTGLPLIRRPQRSASLLLALAPGAWTFSAEGRYVGDREDQGAAGVTTNPGYLRTDLAARFRATERFAPYARVENAASEEYEEVLGFPAPGRRWIGGVAIEL